MKIHDPKKNNKRSFGLRNGKKIQEGYNQERKVKDRKEKEHKRLAYESYTKKFDTTINKVPKALNNTIICGDSLKVLKALPDNCIDIMITSPPYNFGLAYETMDDTNKWQDYFNKLFAIFDECVRVLKYSGRMIVNIQPLFSDYIPTHHIISKYFLDKGLIWKGEVLWEKNNYNCKYTAWGSWKSPSSPYLKYTWEFLEIFCKGDLKKKGAPKNIDITDEEFKAFVVAKWSIAPERNMKQFGHPAMFPEKLVARCLKLFSYKEDLVLDPFNGVGTTTFVAQRLKRNYIGIDISKSYCETAKKRIEAIKNELF